MTLTATPASGFTFAGWSGACSGTGACAVTMNAAKNVTATFTAAPYTLTVGKTGTGSGTITGTGINCGIDCKESCVSGTKVILTAAPSAGSAFAGWTDCTPLAANARQCTVTMSAARVVTARFYRPVLNVAKTGSGAGLITGTGIHCGVDCTEPYNLSIPLRTVTLTATPSAGSTFAGWGGCTPVAANPRQCTVTMSASKTVFARFNTTTPGTYALTLYRIGTGLGTVTSSPAGLNCGAACVANFIGGATVTLTAIPITGSAFAGWGGCTPVAANPRQCTVAMSAARVVTAHFNTTTPGTYALAVAKTGTGLGTVTSSPAGINCGAACVANLTGGVTVTLTATPANGATFGGWSGCVPVAADPKKCTVGMGAARAVTARFNPSATVTLTVTKAGGNGTVTSSPAGISCGATCVTNFASGTTVTLTAAPATGYTFGGWSGACTNTTGTCTVTMTAAKSVTATFAASNLPPMVRITGGCFQMGSPESEWGRRDDETQHQVCVNNFEIGQTEVTQRQWKAIMGTNPAYHRGDDYPVEMVSWGDTQTYLEKLNQQTGRTYRLPTEAEWEYAARAGTTTPFWTGTCVTTTQANYVGNIGYGEPDCGALTGVSRGETTPVKTFPANPWGLYDTMGNVWEWTCSDYHNPYDGAESTCAASVSYGGWSLRGGAYYNDPGRLRSARRDAYGPADYGVGFRLARSL